MKNVTRFARKLFAANLLNARLFGGTDSVKEVLAEIKDGPMRDDAVLEEVVALDASKLQQWVRRSWMCEADKSSRTKHFVDTTVKPALQCSVGSVPDNMADIIARFTAVLRGDAASEGDAINIKLAASCLQGDLDAHPLLQGIALQCRRLITKQKKGIETMRGRREADCSDREKMLIADSGLSLAMACGNKSLAKEFGISVVGCRINMDHLFAHSLPTPCLALLWDEHLKMNFRLADQRYVRVPETCKRILGMA